MSYTSRLTPMAHQLEGWGKLAKRPRSPSSADIFAWLMEMGTGKSKMVTDEWGVRVDANDLSDLLIVAPAGSYLNWVEDKTDLQLAEMKAQLDPALFEKIRMLSWRSGGGSRYREDLTRFLRRGNGRPRVMAVNVEAFSHVDRAYEAAEEFIRSSRRGVMMVVDESTRIKNRKADRTKRVKKLGELVAARRILTGLPSPRSPLDLWSQFDYLDWRILKFRDYYPFRSRYAIIRRTKTWVRGKDGRPPREIMRPVVVNYRNLGEIRQRIEPYSFRKLKSECLDLPPKVYEIHDVELTDEQRRLYREVKDYATSLIRGDLHVSSTSVITQIVRLHQIVCGHVVDDESGGVHDVSSNRERDICEILEGHRDKAIIWTCYGHALKKIRRTLEEEFGRGCTACFWGGNKSSRGEDEKRWLGDPDCRYMISTQGAGGLGNTWLPGTLNIYAANSYDLELRAQSEDRSHRKGQLSERVTYVDLMARGTVEERIVWALRKKIDMAAVITGDNFREWLV